MYIELLLRAIPKCSIANKLDKFLKQEARQVPGNHPNCTVVFCVFRFASPFSEQLEYSKHFNMLWRHGVQQNHCVYWTYNVCLLSICASGRLHGRRSVMLCGAVQLVFVLCTCVCVLFGLCAVYAVHTIYILYTQGMVDTQTQVNTSEAKNIRVFGFCTCRNAPGTKNRFIIFLQGFEWYYF